MNKNNNIGNPRFAIEYFDSKNTCISSYTIAYNWKAAQKKAQIFSENMTFPVVVYSEDGKQFVKFERGIKTEWSA